jgi:hypothetical protein
MANPTDVLSARFRVELGGGEAVVVDGSTLPSAAGGEPVPALTLLISAARAHARAHLVDEWQGAFRLPPDKAMSGPNRLLAEALEAVAAAVGEPGALQCASRCLVG